MAQREQTQQRRPISWYSNSRNQSYLGKKFLVLNLGDEKSLFLVKEKNLDIPTSQSQSKLFNMSREQQSIPGLSKNLGLSIKKKSGAKPLQSFFNSINPFGGRGTSANKVKSPKVTLENTFETKENSVAGNETDPRHAEKVFNQLMGVKKNTMKKVTSDYL